MSSQQLTTRTVSFPLFVAGRIQNDQRENVNVPHAVDAGEESRCELHLDIVVPFPFAFRHLAHYETDNGQSGTQQGGQHQELETINDALVVKTTSCLNKNKKNVLANGGPDGLDVTHTGRHGGQR